MLKFILIGFSLLVVTVSMHATGIKYLMQFLIKRYAGHDGQWKNWDVRNVYLGSAVVLLSLHMLQVFAWALVYLWLPDIDQITSLEKAVYFSMVTFSTLGYGEITLEAGPRLLSGIEAMNGIFLFGWSTGLFFSIVQRSWKSSGFFSSKDPK